MMPDNREIERLEISYRECLAQNPLNDEARGSLAWCLLLHAFASAAGAKGSRRRSVKRDRDMRAGMQIRSTVKKLAAGQTLENTEVLQESLHQAMMNLHLSARPSQRAEMQRLKTLVTHAGGKALVVAMEKKMAQATKNLLFDIRFGTE